MDSQSLQDDNEKRSVFVSHASKNFKIADEVRALLEARGVSCWIAPRDISPGKQYGTAIVDAISGCSVVVLLLTDEANQSPAVVNEIERAFSNQKTIVPIRLRDIKPSKGLEFFVSNAQWLDAFVSPLKGRVEQIVNIVHAIELHKPLPPVQPETPTFLGRMERHIERALRHKILSAAVGFAVLALLSGSILVLQMSSQEGLKTATTSISKSADRIDGAATSLEQSSTTINAIGTKVDGLKKETSDDPRKELTNLGMPWSDIAFLNSLNDEKIALLYKNAGLKIRVSRFYEANPLSEKSAAFLASNLDVIEKDCDVFVQGYGMAWLIMSVDSTYKDPKKNALIRKVCNADMALTKLIKAEMTSLENKKKELQPTTKDWQLANMQLEICKLAIREFGSGT